MNSLDLDVLENARKWLLAGHKVHLVTVVQTWGSAPRQPGALLALREDGHLFGSVSGGCIEDDLAARARAGQLPDHPDQITYGIASEDASRFGLPCGGTLQLVIEPLDDTGWLDDVLLAIHDHKLTLRTLDLQTGAITLAPACPTDGPSFDGRLFYSLYGPPWRLLIIGANQTALVLANIAVTLDFHVIVCDPREEFFTDWELPNVTLVTSMPDDTVLEIGTDERTAIVAVTHDPKLDDMALLEALKSRAFYVGALGSQGNQAKRRERLRMFELTDAEIDRLYGPIGLPIHSRTPAEIAVAIAAQLIKVRNAQSDSLKKARSPAASNCHI